VTDWWRAGYSACVVLVTGAALVTGASLVTGAALVTGSVLGTHQLC